MTTKVDDKKNFEKVWNLFEDGVLKRFGKNKKGETNFSEFAKFNQEQDLENLEENDYKKVYDRLRIMSKRKKSITTVKKGTIEKIEAYYKVLQKNYFKHELLEDEKPNHWFD